MHKKFKWLIGTGLVIGVAGFNYEPVESHAIRIDVGDNLMKPTRGILQNPFFPTEALFVSALDPTRANFYGNTVKALDRNAANRLYKVSDKGLEYWSPIRPRKPNVTGIGTLEYNLENLGTAQKYGKGRGPNSLGDLWMKDPKVTRNFKTVRLRGENNINVNGANKRDMSTIGRAVERSPNVNHGGTFHGVSGEWRFMGYASDGSPMMNAVFPGDYTTPPARNLNWNRYADHGNRLFTISTYNNSEWRSAKRELIRRLLNENPGLKFKTVDQWMPILALQTEPAINPRTGRPDGKYGGATFSAYHTNGGYYRSFVLRNNERTEGNKNLGLMKLTITENQRVNGSYPVVATISRKELESREFMNKRVSDKLVPGKTYRVVSVVENGNKVAATKHTPTSVDIGYSTNYDDSKIETDGVYAGSYNDASKVSTASGNIARGGKKTVVGTFKMPNDLKAASDVRFGALINDNHRKKGDNLNYVDDDLMIAVPVATGNIKATDVVLVDTAGNEVTNPLPGKQYKVRYKFSYTGASQKVPAKVTINYQHTRKLPDGNQEAIVFQNGSTSKKDTSASKNITLKNDSNYFIDSQSYQWYEIPEITANATLSVDAAGLNTNTKDDTFNKKWSDTYDYSIENLQVVARTERGDVATDGKQHYGVSFTVNSIMPKGAQDDNYAKDVNIRVNLGGQTKVITEHITAGKNKDIVVDFALDNPVSPGSSINAKVDVNFDQLAYENGKGVLSNNSATTKVLSSNLYVDPVTKGITNPTLLNGANRLQQNNTGAYVSHPIDPNNMTTQTNDNNENTWTQRYKVDSWNGQKISYRAMNGTKLYEFYRYTPTASYTQNVSQQEQYKIKDVLMRSKVTSDNRWGSNNDGWVSLVNNSGQAQIKAGYGYELKMIVEYATNAFSTEPNAQLNKGSGTSVRPQNIQPNLMEDAYFQTSDGKILSATGMKNTNKVFDTKVVERTKEKLVLEFTLRDSFDLGVRTPGRVYISEDTPNGVYKVRAWTPEINGVATKNKNTDANGHTAYIPSPLMDILGGKVSSVPSPIPSQGKDPNGNLIIDENSIPPMSIVVIGSDTDDIVDSVVQ